ncbi:hypothetical protein HMPREF0322_02689 [Desulfitobacterium hafniense DP7]|uniref:Uncharacterized protein n=1 Tax=Desulfitobacterium hafniense DP7 TaxID=537010 RepID=G9XNZ4_DESHA|nr:hypothetical protein HMPREF0322_02689 [Desulfitobacterium hafniense DP7]
MCSNDLHQLSLSYSLSYSEQDKFARLAFLRVSYYDRRRIL